MAFNPTATGKIFTPTSDAPIYRSMEKMGERILQGERMKLQHAMKEEADFLRMTDVDPVALTNMESQKRQSAALEAFNNDAFRLHKARGGKLTTADKQQLQMDRQILIGIQQKELANQQNWQRDYEMYRRNPEAYDQDVFEAASFQWKTTGEYPQSALEPSAVNVASFLSKNVVATGEPSVRWEPSEGMPGYQTQIKQRGDDQWAGDAIEYNLLMDRSFRAIKGLVNDFDKYTTQEEKRALFEEADINQDGVTDSTEKQSAMITWARTYKPYMNAVQGKSYGTSRKISTGTKSFDSKLGVGAGNNRNNEFRPIKNKTLLGTTFKEYLNLGRLNHTSGPQQIQEYMDLETGKWVPFNTTSRFYVAGYSPDKDLIIVQPKEDTEGAGGSYIYKGVPIAIKASDYDALLKSKPFSIDRASLMKGYTPVSGELDNV